MPQHYHFVSVAVTFYTATYEEIRCILWNELNETLRHDSCMVKLIRPLNKTVIVAVNIIMTRSV